MKILKLNQTFDIGYSDKQYAISEDGILMSRWHYMGEPSTEWKPLCHYNEAMKELVRPPSTGDMGCDEAAHTTEAHFNQDKIVALQLAIQHGLVKCYCTTNINERN